MTRIPNSFICQWYRQWQHCPDGKDHAANMGPIWGQQDPGGPHVGAMNLTIWVWIPYKYSQYGDFTWVQSSVKSPATRLFQQLVLANNIKKSLHCWLFCKGVHRSAGDSPHKGPVIRKGFPCHEIIMHRDVIIFLPLPRPGISYSPTCCILRCRWPKLRMNLKKK